MSDTGQVQMLDYKFFAIDPWLTTPHMGLCNESHSSVARSSHYFRSTVAKYGACGCGNGGGGRSSLLCMSLATGTLHCQVVLRSSCAISSKGS